MNVPEFLAARAMSINALHQATGIAYSTLQRHVTHGKGITLVTAKKLEKWSRGLMTAAEILGLAPAPAAAAVVPPPPPSSSPPAPPPARTKRKAPPARSKATRKAPPARSKSTPQKAAA